MTLFGNLVRIVSDARPGNWPYRCGPRSKDHCIRRRLSILPGCPWVLQRRLQLYPGIRSGFGFMDAHGAMPFKRTGMAGEKVGNYVYLIGGYLNEGILILLYPKSGDLTLNH